MKTFIDYLLGTIFMIMVGSGLAVIWLVAKGWW
jgi:hypothetical protein